MASIWWIRRDLRLRDNRTLIKALENPPIIPIFILDPFLLKNGSDRRRNFLFGNLKSLQTDLVARGSSLIIRTGKPVEVLQSLMQESGADAIYAEEDFTPYDRLRTVLAGSLLPIKLIQGQLGLHPLDALKPNGKPYRDFAPFKRNWMEVVPSLELRPAPEQIPTIDNISSEQIAAGPEEELFPAGEDFANQRLDEFLKKQIEFYHLNRDRMDLGGTSALSPYIRFGVLGLRTALFHGLKLVSSDVGKKDLRGIDTWLNELVWREFYIHILFHFPEARSQNFRSLYDSLQWRNAPSDFQAWKDGRTGFPVVDAAMRQLKHTGWLHNRARTIAASFLVKDLLIDWRWGEKWFRECLLDGDLAVNTGSWQWVAGTGTDAAPFSRILNPARQGKKFDPLGNYIRQWVPEIAHLDANKIHEPWKNGSGIANYPRPLVNHKYARERAIVAYRDIGGK